MAKPAFIRWDDEQRQIVEMAAEHEKVPVSTFVRDAAISRAKEIVVMKIVAESTAKRRK